MARERGGLPWQCEKAAGLVHRLLERGQALIEGNEIEEIAVLAGGGIDPLACAMPGQSHVQTLPCRVGDIADMPIASGAAAVGEIVVADSFRVLRQATRHVGCHRTVLVRTGHAVTPRTIPQE